MILPNFKFLDKGHKIISISTQNAEEQGKACLMSKHVKVPVKSRRSSDIFPVLTSVSLP